MPLVAKRKVRQTWREVVAARADEQGGILLARFDAVHLETDDEGEAAYRVLEAAGLLWRVDEPGSIPEAVAEPEPSSDG